MTVSRLAAVGAALILAATAAAAQAPTTSGMKFAPAPPKPRGHFLFNGFGFGFATPIVERELVTHVIEREVVHEVPVNAAAPPPPPAPEPYVLGRSYASLPSGCMKMVERGATYYNCSGDWYREVGRSRYKAVAAPL